MCSSLTVNSLIKIGEQEKDIERVLWILEEIDVVFLINIFDKSWPHEAKLSELIILINDKKVQFITNEVFYRLIVESELNDKDKNKRDKAFNVVMEFYKYIGEPNIFITHERNKFISKVIKKYGISRRTVEDYVKRYWKRGMNPNALLSDTYRCGGKNKPKVTGEAKRGRPRLSDTNSGINVDDKIKKIFKTSINKFYNNQKKNSLVTAYHLMLKDYFSEKVTNEKGKNELILKDKENIPSLTQFRYWFNKERDLKKEISSRHGSRIFYQKHRAVLHSVNDLVIGPGMEYQIDANIGDVYLISRFNKEWIIGRPVIYIVIDTYSRLVTGVNVTLEGPSWVGAMGALANAMTDKVQFCKEYDIEINYSEWPIEYIPFSIIGDRGEIAGFNADYLVNNLNIKVSNTPPYFPQWKPIVEQHFRLLNLKTQPLMPGAISPDFRERGAKDYRYDAVLNIKQFTKIVILSVLYHNNHHVLKVYRREKGMIEDEIEPIPINLWNWGIKNKSGIFRTAPEELIKLSLMPRDKAIVTENGMRFKGIFYSSVTAIKERLFETARSKGNFKVDIAYDPRNLNNIYWIDKSGTKYEKCFLLKKDYRYLDKTIEEIEYLRQKELLMVKNIERDELEKTINLINEIDKVVKEATEGSKGVKLNSSNVKGIRANRQTEKIISRKEEAFVIGEEETINSGKIVEYPKSDFAEDDDMLLLRKKQKGEKFNE
ncbi:Mu transposase C-terminal domain-containing protein [Clostridium pasteurianum]|uniref:Mu transposase C-terminal domain-containing protein n=1 Tax=Clostridium pasteurianum TaxID=1501 RepID=UPI002260DEC8|nr:Mu transposase C-terminal domain-containing protein [Clostridium pasteurianum]UZW12831.1 Mu transposase C-terminal domain-containing protein [Clostridium pasteurianum]